MEYMIPLQKVANQTVICTLNKQNCIIDIRLLGDDLYLSLSVDGNPICQSVRLVDRSPIVRAKHSGFIGDFAMIDRIGEENPDYKQFNDRFVLLYNEEGYE